MKAIYLLLILLLSSQLARLSAQDALPADSKELVSKLDSYEKGELAKAHQVIKKKRTAVMGILQTHVERETRAGKLQIALALQSRIDALSASKPGEVVVTTPPPAEQAPPTPEATPPAADAPMAPGTNEELRAFVIGPVWGHGKDKGITFQFNADGSGEKVYFGEREAIVWKIKGDDMIETKLGNLLEYFLVDLSQKKIWKSSEEREKRTECTAIE